MPKSGMLLQDETVARPHRLATEVGNTHASPQPRMQYGSMPARCRRGRMISTGHCHACSRPAKVHLAAFPAIVDCDWSTEVTLDRNGVYIVGPFFDLGHRALQGESNEV